MYIQRAAAAKKRGKSDDGGKKEDGAQEGENTGREQGNEKEVNSDEELSDGSDVDDSDEAEDDGKVRAPCLRMRLCLCACVGWLFSGALGFHSTQPNTCCCFSIRRDFVVSFLCLARGFNGEPHSLLPCICCCMLSCIGMI